MLQTASYRAPSETALQHNYAAASRKADAIKQQQQQQAQQQWVSYDGGTSSSRSLDEVVLDLLRGKVAQCYEQLLQVPRSFHDYAKPVAHDWLSARPRTTTTTHSSHTERGTCACKFLVIVECAAATQYWLVQLKRPREPENALTAESIQNYLNCVGSLELYSTLDDVCNGTNCQYRFSNKNWFFFEQLIRFNVLSGADVLLEDFTLCNTCNAF